MMDRFRSSENDIIAELQRSVKELQNQLQQLKNRQKVTIPRYDKAALPDMIDQEVFIGTDHTLNFYDAGVVRNAGP